MLLGIDVKSVNILVKAATSAVSEAERLCEEFFRFACILELSTAFVRPPCSFLPLQQPHWLHAGHCSTNLCISREIKERLGGCAHRPDAVSSALFRSMCLCVSLPSPRLWRFLRFSVAAQTEMSARQQMNAGASDGASDIEKMNG